MTVQRYTKTAIILHWLIALMIAFMFVLGKFMADIPQGGPKAMSFDLFNLGLIEWNVDHEMTQRTFYFNIHKSWGVTILALVVIRIYWRITHRPPALLDTLSSTEKKVATAGHHTLYLLMVLIPISGILMSLNTQYGLKWFDIKLLSGVENKETREIYEQIHEFLGNIIFVVFVIHVLGALKHRFIDKDDTMKRMSLRK